MDEEVEHTRKELEEFKADIGQTAAEMTAAMHRAIGKSITDWSRMEGSLVHIASCLLDSKTNKVGLVLYSINNFHTWLSIIEELFVMDSNFSPLRSDWNEIAGRLRKLNDVRVRLAHHALEPGRALEILESITVENISLETFEDDFDSANVFPSLKPHKNDTRMKWKKKAVSLDEIVTFQEQLIDVIEMMTALLIRMKPIHLGPKQRLVAKIKELQQKAAQQQQTATKPQTE
ncbi:hypothetical protein [Bradyrhizobium sp. CCBAU 21362]|uniref:hypothetical protein n=1 Tax=Bradyrhizobium sp. CCBAU 21362 TaxID=1325082 RepID=UPI00230653E5|nr:hypothetical protein [Bradyrhizobium sp. CCBAU 21362]